MIEVPKSDFISLPCLADGSVGEKNFLFNKLLLSNTEMFRSNSIVSLGDLKNTIIVNGKVDKVRDTLYQKFKELGKKLSEHLEIDIDDPLEYIISLYCGGKSIDTIYDDYKEIFWYTSSRGLYKVLTESFGWRIKTKQKSADTDRVKSMKPKAAEINKQNSEEEKTKLIKFFISDIIDCIRQFSREEILELESIKGIINKVLHMLEISGIDSNFLKSNKYTLAGKTWFLNKYLLPAIFSENGNLASFNVAESTLRRFIHT